jgi:hypothetical protein
MVSSISQGISTVQSPMQPQQHMIFPHRQQQQQQQQQQQLLQDDSDEKQLFHSTKF